MKPSDLIDISDSTDLAYWRRRAEEELALARLSTSPQAERFRYHLAGLYFDRYYGAQTAQAR
jgi:hypothetical protein